MHSRLRQCAHSVLQADHLLHSVHAPSTAGAQHRRGHAVPHCSGNTETVCTHAGTHPPTYARMYARMHAPSISKRVKILKVTDTKKDQNLGEKTLTPSHIHVQGTGTEGQINREQNNQGRTVREEAAEKVRL